MHTPVPTLILWGEEDRFQVVKYGQRLAWDLPVARFVAIQGARHFVMLDQPEAVAKHASEWLAD